MADEFKERRDYPRIQIAAPIEIQGAVGSPASELGGLLEGSGLTLLRAATLVDLSRGGVRFSVSEQVGAVGDTLQLFLPSLRGGEVGLYAEIVRCERVGETWQVAAKYCPTDQVPLSEHHELLDVLLAAPDGGQRIRPRVVHRMQVRYGERADSQAVLECISAGGMQITATESFFAGDQLTVVLPDSRGEDLLTIKARVVNQRPIPGGDPVRYAVGMAFINLSPERLRCLHALIECLIRGGADLSSS